MTRGEPMPSSGTTETRAERPAPTPPTLGAIEIAGALQATLKDVENRDFSLQMQQDLALDAIGKAILDGKKNGYIEMATSSGKTTIEALLAEATVKSGKRVLMVVPGIKDARQLHGKNQTQPTGLERFTSLNGNASVGHQYDNKKASAANDIVITTYASLRSVYRNDPGRLGEFDLIIADECHRSLGLQTAKMMKAIYPDALRIGFSATPDYAIDRSSNEVFEEQWFEFALRDAIESGVTAPIRALLYETDQKLELTDPHQDFTERELAPLIDNAERNGLAYNLALDLVADGRQGYIRCIPGQGNIHARILAALLTERGGIQAADIGSHLSPQEIAQRLALFQQGKIDVLTYTRALEESWDTDRASFGINTAPTTSPVVTKQNLGRALRKNRDGRESMYIDFVDNKTGYQKEQYTALHALELQTVDTDRVLGTQRHGEHDVRFIAPELPPLRPEIIARLTRNNGRLLDDVMVTYQAKRIDPLFAKWERILSDEKLPAELPDNEFLGTKVEKDFRKVFDRLTHEQDGVPPTPQQVLAELQESKTIPIVRKALFGQYGVKLAFGAIEPKTYHTGKDDVIDHVASKLLRPALDSALASITTDERAEEIIRMRFGLTEEEKPKSLHEIAKHFDITVERVRQLEAKAMAQLRASGRRHGLIDFVTDGEHTSQNYIPLTPEMLRAINLENSLYDDIDHLKDVQLKLHDIITRFSEPGYEFTLKFELEDFAKSLRLGVDVTKTPIDKFAYIMNRRQSDLLRRIRYYQSRKEMPFKYWVATKPSFGDYERELAVSHTDQSRIEVLETLVDIINVLTTARVENTARLIERYGSSE